jgi:O-antigen ligase
MRVTNIENEYVGTLLSAGLVGLAALLVVLGRRVWGAWKDPSAVNRVLCLPILLAFAVNIATYNLFSWSAGALMFTGITVLLASSGRDGSSDERFSTC